MADMCKNRINRRGGIQRRHKRHFYMQDFQIEISLVQSLNKPVSDRNIERTKAVSDCLLHQMNVVNDIIDLKHINKEKLEKEFHEQAIKTAITKMNIHHSELPIQNYDEEEYKNEQLGLHYNDYDNDMKDDYNILRNKLKLFLKEDNIHNFDMIKRNNNKKNSSSTSKVVKKKKGTQDLIILF